MKCSVCGIDSRKQHLNTIAEPGKKVVALCPKCWHKFMKHSKADIPDGQGDE
jgi:hypothetical protein